MTNREAYLKAKKLLLQFKDNDLHDSEIYLLLIRSNGYHNFTELIKNFDENLANPASFERNLNRLIKGEPIQYITEEAPFFDLDLKVNHNVLIPRPETEGLVKFLIYYINENKFPHNDIADVCTGSGCIAAYLKKTFPYSNVYAIDKYQDCIEVAEYNFRKYNLSIYLLMGNRLYPLIDRGIKLDILVSNPPYVSNMDDIEKIVKDNEPMTAIYTQDGTKFYESFFKHHKEVMKERFLMAFEINYDQEEKLTFLINNYFDLTKIKYKFVKDVFGKTRYLFIEGNYENN